MGLAPLYLFLSVFMAVLCDFSLSDVRHYFIDVTHETPDLKQARRHYKMW